MLKFYWNGIKDAGGGKLQTCHYSMGKLIGYPAGTITIYKREYASFTASIRAALSTANDSDYQSDYIVTDVIRVDPDHPLYVSVRAAFASQEAHRARQARKRAERCMRHA